MDSSLEALVSASATGDVVSVKALFEDWRSAADPVPERPLNEPNYYLQPVLEAAMRNNQLSVVSYLVEQGFQITRAVVAAAVGARSRDGLELLLTAGWNINNRWNHHLMPSMVSAICQNDLELVQWFLSHGANPNIPRGNGYTSCTPLTYAVIYASIDVVKLLVTYGSSVTRGYPLHAVSRYKVPGRLEVLVFLLDRGADMNAIEHAKNSRRFAIMSGFGVGTPLHAAVQNNRITIASILLERGADREIKDTKGRRPLDLAMELQHPRMVELLES